MRRLPVGRLPGLARLPRGHAEGDPEVAPFLGPPASAGTIAARAAEVLARFAPREAPHLPASLRDLAAGARAAVLTGQQVGLFTGPLLTLVKALAARGLAADLAERGTPATPVFWCASEDHDLVEVSRFVLPTAEGPVDLGEEAAALAGNRLPVGGLRISADVVALLEAARSQAGSLADDEALGALRDLTVGRTYLEAFADTLRWLLDDPDQPLADAARPDEKPPLVPLAVRIVLERATVRRLLDERAAALAAAGHPLQVVSEPGALPLFARVDGERLLLREAGGRIELKGRPHESYTPEEVAARFESGAWLPSFSALGRPVAVSVLYPVAATILGPAEVAYWAQALPLFGWAGVVPPVLVLRPMVAVLGPLERRLLSKAGIEVEELLAGPDAVVKARGAARAGELLGALERARDAAVASLEEVRSGLLSVDPSLGKGLDATEENVRFAFGKLAERTRAAAGRADEAFARSVRRLADLVVPNGTLAERIYTPVPWLARMGRRALVGALEEAVRWDAPGLVEVEAGGEGGDA